MNKEKHIKNLKHRIKELKLESNTVVHRVNMDHAPIFKRIFYIPEEIERCELQLTKLEEE